MTKYARPLPKATTDAMYGAWLAVVKRKECASVLSLPHFDREYRAAQFADWLNAQGEKHIHVVPIALHTLVTEDWEKLSTQLNSLKHARKYTVFMVTDAEWLLIAAPHLLFRFQSYVIHPYRSSSFIFFFERNAFDSSYADYIKPEALFVENVFYQELYKKDDIFHFLQHMEHLYGFSLSVKDRETIWNECRGYLWLTTEALRYAHKTGKISFTHEAFLLRVKAIWEGLSEGERRVLLGVVSGAARITNDVESWAYIEKTGLVTDNGNTCALSVPVLERYIRLISRKEHQLRLSADGHVYIGAVAVDSILSEKERALVQVLLKRSGTVISRDDIAKAVWGGSAEFEYSDWNLDQLISRLRKRLTRMGVPDDVIKTAKRKGLYVTD